MDRPPHDESGFQPLEAEEALEEHLLNQVSQEIDGQAHMLQDQTQQLRLFWIE